MPTRKLKYKPAIKFTTWSTHAPWKNEWRILYHNLRHEYDIKTVRQSIEEAMAPSIEYLYWIRLYKALRRANQTQYNHLANGADLRLRQLNVGMDRLAAKFYVRTAFLNYERSKFARAAS